MKKEINRIPKKWHINTKALELNIVYILPQHTIKQNNIYKVLF